MQRTHGKYCGDPLINAGFFTTPSHVLNIHNHGGLTRVPQAACSLHAAFDPLSRPNSQKKPRKERRKGTSCVRNHDEHIKLELTFFVIDELVCVIPESGLPLSGRR